MAVTLVYFKFYLESVNNSTYKYFIFLILLNHSNMKNLFLVTIISLFAIFMACERNIEEVKPDSTPLLKTDLASNSERDQLVAKIMEQPSLKASVEKRFYAVQKYIRQQTSMTKEELESFENQRKTYLTAYQELEEQRTSYFVEDPNYEQAKKTLQQQFPDLKHYFNLQEHTTMMEIRQIAKKLQEDIPELQHHEEELFDLYNEAVQNSYRQLFTGAYG